MNNHCQGDQAEGVEQKQPALCTNGCGFFANPACNNMCSKCYRDSQMTAERAAVSSKVASAAISGAQQLVDIKEGGGLENVPKRPKAASPRAEPPVRAAEVPSPSEQPASPEASAKPESSSMSPTSEPPQRPVQKNPGRCFVCNKKVGLTGFKCRCEYVFCGAHRLAEAHDCSIDYKQIGRQRLAENNPLVQAAKIHKV